MSLDQQELDSAVKQLSVGIQEIKLNTEILVTKLAQVNDNIEKLEASVEDLHMSISEQDRRLTILEQRVPQDLVQDMAVMKQSNGAYTKLLWLIGGVTLTTFANMLFNLVTK